MRLVAWLVSVLAFMQSGNIVAKSVSFPESDTLTHVLRNVNVQGQRVRSYIGNVAGASVLSMDLMELMPRILGNADPMHYAQLLPGVQTNSEYDAGLHIQGCENSHNMVAIDGVPLYNVAHMLGFFSVFNATHFSNLTLQKSLVSPTTPNRLGGMVDMHTSDSLVRRIGGDVSVGPMSSQGTLRLPLGRRASLVLSAREAYLNLLYGRWLNMDGDQMRYSFGDYNLSLLFCPDESNALRLETYIGHDNLGLEDGSYLLDSRLRWGNLMAAIHWKHLFRGGGLSQSVYFTGYGNRFSLEQTDASVRLKSGVCDLGYKASLSLGRLDAGIELARHTLQPQSYEAEGKFDGSEMVGRQRTVEASLYAAWRFCLSKRVDLTCGTRVSAYVYGSEKYFNADPGATLDWHISPLASLSFNAGTKHQYLIQTGFSNIGMPTEFWLSSGGSQRPQYSCNVSAAFETLTRDRAWRISCELYYKRLFHQVEYSGNVFDFVYSSYSLEGALLHGNGYNYGANLMLERRKGRLTGWISYSFGRAIRRYPGTELPDRYPAIHERPHELNAVATFKLGRRWSIGTTFVAASGIPYTKVERFYLISNHIVADYGTHNAERLPMYMRLDLSVNYAFRSRQGRKSGINFSLYNVTAHENVLLYRLKVTRNERTMAYNPLSFVAPLLPSVNYYYSF